MTQLIPLETDHLVGYRIEGTVNKADFDRVARLIEERLERHDTLQLYVEIRSFEGVTLEVLLKDFVFGVKHFDRFDRIAIVTDTKWVERILSLEGMLVPGIELQTFSFEEKAMAMEWVLSPVAA